ncbi:hypothetical protein Rsub_12246 [Raphidocelis subcapitata]|uniref:Uncharacterized protein n=1 Tax=Raphidocelis subcapitata TaxID=307507 RepID=A0A2V0PHY8_9CHLO|nr:hypothetical protein Rsub_12246 [Raphidocelis subcapitata]|eukprot:GBF99414.1 hypothetical protein Rsub_12246 [Raphidocelis subcapitata]
MLASAPLSAWKHTCRARASLPRAAPAARALAVRQRQRQRRPGRGMAAAPRAGASDVFVLDFDGVLVDSEPEVSTSAFDAARDYWPAAFASADGAAKEAVLQGLRECRPVLVRGYESMVMARLLVERPGAAAGILGGWEELLPATLEAWGEDWLTLQRSFEEHRAGWLDRDRAGWLACNTPYPGVFEALAACEAPFYIASSKAAHRVAALATGVLGVPLAQDSPRLFCSLLPPNEKKVEALRAIEQRPVCEGARLHFVDDRLETLKAAVEAGLAGRWGLYLADWGYCTEEEKAEAAALPGVRRLALRDFLELLKWGLVAGVDDGCEPTEEEVRGGVK